MADSVESLILQKLEKYGDTFVEGKIKKKRKNDGKEDGSETKKVKTDMMVSTSVTTSRTLSRRQKKRMKKKKKEEPKEKNNEKDSASAPKLSGPERSLKEMSERLGLEEFKKERDRKMEERKEELREKKKNKPEVVVFKSHKPKKKVQAQAQSKCKVQPVFDLDAARFEVRKFGMKGLEGTEKKEAMTALLVKLGAKPPKNKCVSIKEYMKNRPKQLLEEKEKRETDRRLGNKVTKANRESKRSRDKEDIGFIDGQIGFWKNGVQVVTKDALKRSGLKMAKSK